MRAEAIRKTGCVDSARAWKSASVRAADSAATGSMRDTAGAVAAGFATRRRQPAGSPASASNGKTHNIKIGAQNLI